MQAKQLVDKLSSSIRSIHFTYSEHKIAEQAAILLKWANETPESNTHDGLSWSWLTALLQNSYGSRLKAIRTTDAHVLRALASILWLEFECDRSIAAFNKQMHGFVDKTAAEKESLSQEYFVTSKSLLDNIVQRYDALQVAINSALGARACYNNWCLRSEYGDALSQIPQLMQFELARVTECMSSVGGKVIQAQHDMALQACRNEVEDEDRSISMRLASA